MSFLDPKPLTVAGLDAATAAKVNTPASATATAVSTKIAAASVSVNEAPIDLERFGVTGNGVTDDTAAIQAALATYSSGGTTQAQFLLRRNKNYRISSPLVLNARKATLVGNRSTMTYTGSGVAIQMEGGSSVTSQGQTAIDGLILVGPGKATTSIGIQLNQPDALTTNSYVAGHPFKNVTIEGFGVGVKQQNRAWGNTFTHAFINKCGTGFLVPSGLTSSQGERLSFDDSTIAECDTAIDVIGGHVDMYLMNSSLDYNKVAYKGNAFFVMTGGHVETKGNGAPGATWTGTEGHFQHTGAVARTVFNGVRFVITGAHTELFEPWNGDTDFIDETSLDAFFFNQPTFSWGTEGPWSASFASRLAGFPHKRYVNEANGRRGSRRGIFRGVGTTDCRPYFGTSVVPGRTQTAALPTVVPSVSAGDALVKGAEILADQSGTKPISAVTWAAPATAAGTNNAIFKVPVYVGPDDVGRMFLADVRADITVTGADSQRVGYINFKAQNGVTLMSAEAAMVLTTVPTGTNAGLSLLPTYSQLKVPAGTHYAEIELQLTKIRNGDSITLYHPQVNVV